MLMKFDYSKLRGRFIEKFGSKRAFVRELKVGDTAFTNKMHCRVPFKNDEIIYMAKLLDISNAEIPDYFFCVKD